MSKWVHRVYVWSMATIVVLVAIYLSYTGHSYYKLPLEERFYHPNHDWFKPSGLYGHGLGIVGTLCIMIGVFGYIARKRYGFLERFIRLKYLLEFHIFLCVLGPLMVLFHTAFKFGGIVSIAFWSMVAVVASGAIGRFIYIQIPRTIEGRELSLQEVQEMRSSLVDQLGESTSLSESFQGELLQNILEESEKGKQMSFVKKYFHDRQMIKWVRQKLKGEGMPITERSEFILTMRKEISLNYKIQRLLTMQKLFKYWHVAHLPFALIMLIIVIIHVGVTLAFGYKWIF
jgi:hypothetical protein